MTPGISSIFKKRFPVLEYQANTVVYFMLQISALLWWISIYILTPLYKKQKIQPASLES